MTKNHEGKKRKSGGFRNAAEGVALLAAMAVLCVSIWQLASIYLEYRAGDEAYDNLEDSFIHMDEIVDMQKPEPEEEEGAELLEKEEYFPAITVDYAGLAAVNKELTGWLYIPALDLGYPVVQGKDNSFYQSHTFEKKENRAGAIFMDYRCDAGLTDLNTIIYGHNMKNGSMFGTLKKFGQEESLYEEDPWFYYFTENEIRKYRIISYYVTKDGSSSYAFPSAGKEYESWRDMILNYSVRRCTEELPEGAPVMTLSTCYGRAGGDLRFLVHGILTAVAEN